MPTASRLPSSLVPLDGDGLVLRAFRDADVPALVVAFDDPDIRGYNPGPESEDADAGAREWLEQRNDWSGGGHASWAIRDPGGDLLGSVSLFEVHEVQLTGEVGFWVTPSARGHGLAGRAVRCAAAFAFAEMGVHRLYLHHSVENIASCRVTAATGFRLEGTLRKSWRYGDGKFHDEHLHGRLASDEQDQLSSAGARRRWK